MEKIEIFQNTGEWLKMRENFIGASESNIIMGVSQFSTPSELLQWKIYPNSKPEKDNTFITDKGHRLEEKNRAYHEMKLDDDFPALVIRNESFPFLMASLDGYSEKTKRVLEAKYVGQDDFEKVKNGQYLEKYYPQMQHQMLLAEADENILAVVKENKDKSLEYAHMVVKLDLDYCKKELLPKLIEFWDKVQEGRKGEKVELELTKDDVLDQNYDKELKALVRKYKKELEKQSKINQEVSDLKDAIFKSIKHSKVNCAGATINLIETKGRETFDYKKYFKDKKEELPAEYVKTGKPSQTKKITFKEK